MEEMGGGRARVGVWRVVRGERERGGDGRDEGKGGCVESGKRGERAWRRWEGGGQGWVCGEW